MRKKTVSSPDFSETWSKAGDLLADSGNRLLLIGALVTLLPVFLLYVVISITLDTVIFLFGGQFPLPATPLLISLLFDLFLIALLLLFVLPLIIGFFRMCHHTVRRQDVMLADLFECFESGTCYRHSLSLSFFLLWRVGLLTAVTVTTCRIAVTWFGNGIVTGLACGLIVLAEVAVGLPLILRCFPVWAIAIDRNTSRAIAARAARRIAKRVRMSGILFLFNMVPRILLGLLTFGIFLIWEVLPRMCIAYFLYCNELYETSIIQSEE